MEHTAAISTTLIPLLLGIIGVLLAVIAYHLKRSLERNEVEHDQFFKKTNEHEIRLAKVETEVTHLQQEGRN